MEAAPFEEDGMVCEALAAAPLTNVTESMTRVEYALPAPCTVLSSGNGKSVDIASYSLEAEYVYRSVRKLAKDVFLVASVKSWEDLNFLAGDASSFFEGKYVGSSYIDSHRVDESLRISLGCDKGVVVARIKGKDSKRKSLIGSSVKCSREWVLTARNLKNQAIQIAREDQLPVSINKSITVEALCISGAEYDESTGRLQWIFTLEPSESRSVTVKYAVTYPGDQSVGLE